MNKSEAFGPNDFCGCVNPDLIDLGHTQHTVNA